MSSRLPQREKNLTAPTKIKKTDLIRALIRHVIDNADPFEPSDPEGIGVLLVATC